jgi:hypothetical protein
MATRRLCVNEITSINSTDTFTLTCTPAYTPVNQADPSECNGVLYNVAFTLNPVPTISYSYDVQLKYAYMNQGTTFERFCYVSDQAGSLTFDDSITAACCGIDPSITYSLICNPAAITTTQNPKTVAGPITLSFTVDNLCASTILCIEDTPCPV